MVGRLGGVPFTLNAQALSMAVWGSKAEGKLYIVAGFAVLNQALLVIFHEARKEGQVRDAALAGHP